MLLHGPTVLYCRCFFHSTTDKEHYRCLHLQLFISSKIVVVTNSWISMDSRLNNFYIIVLGANSSRNKIFLFYFCLYDADSCMSNNTCMCRSTSRWASVKVQSKAAQNRSSTNKVFFVKIEFIFGPVRFRQRARPPKWSSADDEIPSEMVEIPRPISSEVAASVTRTFKRPKSEWLWRQWCRVTPCINNFMDRCRLLKDMPDTFPKKLSSNKHSTFFVKQTSYLNMLKQLLSLIK